MSWKRRFFKDRSGLKRHRETKISRDKHHVYPRSRKKKGDLGKFKTILGSLRLCTEIKTHAAWHHLFGQMFPEEAIALLKIAAQEGLHATPEIIAFIKHSLQPRRAVSQATNEDLNAWQKIFGERANFRPLRKIIIKDWTYPGVKAIVLNKKVVKVTIFLPKISSNIRLFSNIYRCRNIRVSFLKNGQLLKIS